MSNPANAHPAGPRALASTLLRHRGLIAQLVRQEIAGRYRGSMLGLAWSFVTPILMLLIYTFVFSIVFQARWGEELEGGGRAAFAVVLFAGMAVFGIFSDVAVRAPSIIIANTNYVKRVVFPIEILPVVQMGSALFHFAVALLAWAVAAWAVFGALPWTALLLPLVVAPLVIGTVGLAWILASLGVFLRDLGQSIGLVVTALLFLTPIFYPLEAIPVEYRGWIRLNPLTTVIDQARDVLVFGRVPPYAGLAASWLGGVAFAIAGFAWFQKTRKGFADVL